MKSASTKLAAVIALVAISALGNGRARGALLLAEPFSYSGATLNGNSGAFGTSGSYATWVPSNSPAAQSLILASTSLSYPAGTTLKASGGSVSDGTGAYQDGSYIPLASPISMATGGTYYISFLVSRFGSATSQAFFGVDLNSGETLPRTSQDLTFGCGSSGYIRTGGDNQGGSLPNTIATSSAYVVAPGATSATAGTYLVVGKIVCAGGSVTTYMSEYASATATVPSAEPTSWEVTSGTTSTSATYTNLQIRKGADMGTNIDEILIGTTYADVTQAQPVPDASSAVATTALALMSLSRRRRTN